MTDAIKMGKMYGTWNGYKLWIGRNGKSVIIWAPTRDKLIEIANKFIETGHLPKKYLGE